MLEIFRNKEEEKKLNILQNSIGTIMNTYGVRFD